MYRWDVFQIILDVAEVKQGWKQSPPNFASLENLLKLFFSLIFF